MLTEKRETFNKASIIQSVVPSATIWDLNLNKVEGDYGWLLSKLRSSSKVLFAWCDGAKLSMWLAPENDGSLPQWNTLLEELGIKAIVGAKLTKRMKRLFSPRDIVLSMPQEDIRIEVVDPREFTRFADEMTEDQLKMVGDGAGAISYSFTRRILKRSGLSVGLIREMEGLSAAAVTEQGMLKAFLFPTPDKLMVREEADIVVTSENIKKELISTPGALAWFVADVFHHHRDPKTHGMLDAFGGRMLHHLDTDVSYLADVLIKDKERIISGHAVKSLEEWNMPDLRAKVESSNKVNADFAALSDMTADMVARGLDYRWFPGLMDMLATALSNQWYSVSRDWAYYPLPCAWSRPFLSETMAIICGQQHINVERGTVRGIKGGHVQVFDDLDYVQFVVRNAGGGDLDDHITGAFREVVQGNTTYDAMFNPDKEPEDFKGVLMLRTPNGHREYSLFKYVEGDPFPTYTNQKGEVISFPRLPGKLRKSAAHAERDGEMVITGVGDFAPVVYPSVYGPEVVCDLIMDQLSGEAGPVGSVINAMILAEVLKPELLDNAPAETETVIDSFRQGGSAEVRCALSEWGESLISIIGAEGEIDAKLWESRSNGSDVTGAKLVKGYWTKRHEANAGLRRHTVTAIKDAAQKFVSKPTPLFVEICAMFGVSTAAIKSTDHPIIAKARSLEEGFRYSVVLLNEQLRADQAESGYRKNKQPRMNAGHWTNLYQAHLARIMAAADGNETLAGLLVLANWAVCMGKPTSRGRITDRSIMNSKLWPLFVQALVEFGLARDLNRVVAGYKEHTVKHNFTAVCRVCDKRAILNQRSNYALHIQNNRICKDCR